MPHNDEAYFKTPPKMGYFDDKNRTGLPNWAYRSEKFYEYEMKNLFLNHWQVVCHESSLRNIGDYMSFRLGREKALVIKGDDGKIRAFYNICRHRSSQLVANSHGNCGKSLTCPFHGWIYNLDGTLRGPAEPKTFGNFDKSKYGLTPIDIDIWHGIIFIRFLPGPQPSVQELLAPLESQVALYPMHEIIPQIEEYDNVFSNYIVESNWKCALDVDNEGYHVPKLHPYLQDLYGGNYIDIPLKNGVSVSRGVFNDKPKKFWTIQAYKELTAKYCNKVKDIAKQQYLYIGLFPNNILQFYPDAFSFYQHIPLSSSQTVQPYANYIFGASDSREMKLINKLNNRIDKYTAREDMDATRWTYEATYSTGYKGVYLSELERNVHAYHEKMRELMPILRLEKEPLEY